jgi:hypothetical protein
MVICTWYSQNRLPIKPNKTKSSVRVNIKATVVINQINIDPTAVLIVKSTMFL